MFFNLFDIFNRTSTQILACITIVLVLLLTIVAIPKMQIESDLRGKYITKEMRPATVNEYRKTILQAAGGLVVAFGLYLTWRRIKATEGQLFVSEEGLITDRFTKAIEQLGSDNLAVRLGGIYSLERVARDSKKDLSTITEVLSAYVREKARLTSDTVITDEENKDAEGIEVKPETDIQAILTVLGRIRRVANVLGVISIDLQKTDLRGANLTKIDLPWINLKGADLRRANLEEAGMVKANFEDTCLQGANLKRANLRGATFLRSNLKRADLSFSNLQGANLVRANLQHAQLYEVNLERANLRNADFQWAFISEANFKNADLQGAILEEILVDEIRINTIKQLCEARDLSNIKPDSMANEIKNHCPEKLIPPIERPGN